MEMSTFNKDHVGLKFQNAFLIKSKYSLNAVYTEK